MIAESILQDRVILYMFKAEGCHACEAALPEMHRYMSDHPTMTILILDAAGPFPEQLGVKIRATPTYALRVGDRMFKIEGAMKSSDIKKWIRKIEGEL